MSPHRAPCDSKCQKPTLGIDRPQKWSKPQLEIRHELKNISAARRQITKTVRDTSEWITLPTNAAPTTIHTKLFLKVLVKHTCLVVTNKSLITTAIVLHLRLSNATHKELQLRFSCISTSTSRIKLSSHKPDNAHHVVYYVLPSARMTERNCTWKQTHRQ